MKRMKPRAGFTLIELIIFIGIFSVAMGAFMSVFMDVSGVAVRQSSIAEVQSQSQFLLQTIQHYVERSSMISMEVDEGSSRLELRMPSSTEDPVVFSMSGNAVKLTTKSGLAQAATSTLTSNKVEVSNLAFTRRSNPGGKDSVSASFVITYAAGNPTQRFGHSLRSSFGRVSAATFDSDLVPDESASYDLGTSPEHWRSINNTIFFSGSRVGIGISSPSSPLEVSGKVEASGNVETGGDVYVSNSTKGVILNDGAACWRVRVSSLGALTTASVACP